MDCNMDVDFNEFSQNMVSTTSLGKKMLQDQLPGFQQRHEVIFID